LKDEERWDYLSLKNPILWSEEWGPPHHEKDGFRPEVIEHSPGFYMREAWYGVPPRRCAGIAKETP
jgi:hypothetical protein